MKKLACFWSSLVWFLLFVLTATAVLAQSARGLSPVVATTQSNDGQNDALILRTSTVSLMVSVTDAEGRFVSGLRKEAFNVFEDGIAQEICFFNVADSPASIGIVFDVSGSMRGSRIEKAREALARFVLTTHPNDEFTLVVFNDRTQLLLDRISDGARLADRVGGFMPTGQTALYDAVALALGQVQQGRYAKRALIVISDGDDNRSRISLAKLSRMIRESDVLIYTVAFKDFISRSQGAT